MISPLPWSLDEGNPSTIYDADGDIIAEDYKFIHVDDFEVICKVINSSLLFAVITDKKDKKHEQTKRKQKQY